MINKEPSDKKFQSWMDFVSDFILSVTIFYLADQNPETDNIIRLRGMPFEAGAPEIVKFFEGKLSLEKSSVSHLMWVADSFLSHGWVVEGGGIPWTFLRLLIGQK